MAAERARLLEEGYSEGAIGTMQAARSQGTAKVYDGKWRVFESWCFQHAVDPWNAGLVNIANFLDYQRSSKTLAFSTVKGYLAAIAAFHPKIDGFSAYTHPRLKAFLRGAQNAENVRSERSAPWDLSLVLEALCGGCYEPLEAAELSAISHKLALLLALMSAGRVSELAPCQSGTWGCCARQQGHGLS